MSQETGRSSRDGASREPGTDRAAPRAGTVWRIRRRATFQDLRRGRRGRAGPCTVSWVAGSADEPPQVAYAIGRRVGPAVVRNRLRRRLRMIVRDLAADLPPGAYLIGMAPEAAALTYDELRKTVPRAIAQATQGRTAPRRGDER